MMTQAMISLVIIALLASYAVNNIVTDQGASVQPS
jgi:uncharacterized membrane protein YwzB